MKTADVAVKHSVKSMQDTFGGSLPAAAVSATAEDGDAVALDIVVVL